MCVCAASLSMKPCRVLILSTIIPVEARLSYVTLRHTAYADTGVATLGRMVTNIMVRQHQGGRARGEVYQRGTDPP